MIKLKAGKWHHDGALGSCLLFNCYEISSFKLVLILDELIREDQWIFSRSIHAKSDFQVTFSIILDHFFQLFWIILYNLIDKPVFQSSSPIFDQKLCIVKPNGFTLHSRLTFHRPWQKQIQSQLELAHHFLVHSTSLKKSQTIENEA